MTSKLNHLPAVSDPLAFLIIFIASLNCMNSYNGSFAFDDTPAIINNPDIKFTPISNIFGNDFWGNKLTHKLSHRSYRPLTVLTFRFQHWIRGHLNATDFHVFNLLLHTSACLLTYPTFKQILEGDAQYLAFYSATLFAVHPVHCEAVSGIVGRADVLCAIFVYLSILSYAQCINSSSRYESAKNFIICIFCVAAAMLSKEIGITAIGLCLGYEILIVQKKNFNNLWRLLRSIENRNTLLDMMYSSTFIRFVALSIIGVILLTIRLNLMGFSNPTFQSVDNPASFVDSVFFRYLNYQYIYSLNVWLLICPQWLSFDWSMGCIALINGWDIRLMSILIFWVILARLIFQSFISEGRHSSTRYEAMGLCLMIIPFLPASNLFFRVGFVLAERTLYLPSVGYCFIIVIGLEKMCQRFPTSKIPLVMYWLLIITWFSRSWMRSGQWQDEESLFRSALSVCPHNAKVHYNVAKTAADFGNVTLAEAKYREALRLNPEYAQAMNNLGNLLKDQKRYKEARDLLTRAVELQTDFAAAWMNLGIVHAALEQYNESKRCYETSLFHRQKCPDCYYNLGLLFLERKEYVSALAAWEKAIEQDNFHRKSWTNIIRLLDDLGMAERALEKGRIAIELLPNDAIIHLNVANILGKAERFSEAEIEFQRALTLDKTNPMIYTNLGVLYHRWNKLDVAEKMYIEALKIDPNAQNVKNNIKKLHNLLKST